MMMTCSYHCMTRGLTKGVKYLLGGTFGYGLAHAIPQVQSYKTFIYPSSQRHLLWVDKVCLAAAITASTPLMWPWMLREDLIRVECLVRGKPIRDYLPASDDP